MDHFQKSPWHSQAPSLGWSVQRRVPMSSRLPVKFNLYAMSRLILFTHITFINYSFQKSSKNSKPLNLLTQIKNKNSSAKGTLTSKFTGVQRRQGTIWDADSTIFTLRVPCSARVPLVPIAVDFDSWIPTTIHWTVPFSFCGRLYALLSHLKQ